MVQALKKNMTWFRPDNNMAWFLGTVVGTVG